MSTNSSHDLTVLVQGLASHVNRAAQSSAGGTAAPGSPPVQSAEGHVQAAQQPPREKCECCGKNPRHEGQEGGKVVTEDEWYGLDEGEFLFAERAKINQEIDEFVSKAPEETKKELASKGLAPSQLAPGPLRKRSEKNKDLIKRFEMRRDAVDTARKNECRILPDSSCNVYRVVSPNQAKTLEAEWDLERAQFEASNGIRVGEKVEHRVPLAAGGCPTGSTNLVAENGLSKTCLESLRKLKSAQQEAVSRWILDGF